MNYVSRGAQSKEERGWLSRLRQLLNEGAFMRGSLVCREHTCGKESCRCMKDKKYRHSSWYIGRSIKGKTYMKYISHEQIKEIKGWMKRYSLARTLLRNLGDVSWRRISKGAR